MLLSCGGHTLQAVSGEMSPQISWDLVTQRITEESVKSSMPTRDQRPQEASYTQTLGQPPTPPSTRTVTRRAKCTIGQRVF